MTAGNDDPENLRPVVEDPIERAIWHFSKGELPQAHSFCQKALKTNPNHFVALHLTGVLYLSDGNSKAAVEHLSKAVSLNPNDPEAFSNLGAALERLDRLQESVASYEKALLLRPDFPDAHNNIGNVLRRMDKPEQALVSYYRAVSLDPDHGNAHYNIGAQLMEAGEFEKAVPHLTKALSLQPGDIATLNRLGLVCDKLRNPYKAEGFFREAIRIHSGVANVHFNLANSLAAQGKLDDALASYDHALDVQPDYASAHQNKGVALLEMGDLGGAEGCYRKALTLEPDNAEVHRFLASIKKFTTFDTDVSAMEDLFNQAAISDTQKMHLAFGLGKAYEDLHRYEEAFRFFAIGNELKRKTNPYSIADETKRHNTIKQLFDTPLAASTPNPETLSGALKPVFVFGMMRSGSTLVEQILASHPDIIGVGEVSYFRDSVQMHFGEIDGPDFAAAVQQASNETFLSVGKTYLTAIQEHTNATDVFIDKRLDNFLLVGLLKKALPHAKFIHCTRDPLDTCLSIYKNYFRSDSCHYAYDMNDLGAYYRLCVDMMDHWQSLYPGEILSIQYEELVANQEAVSKQLVSHCGLDWNSDCLTFYKSRRSVKTASSVQVRSPLYTTSVRSWENYGSQLTPLREALGEHLG